MISYVGLNNILYTLDKEIAHGEEGTIFSLVGDSTHVAKIFHPNNRTSNREQKIKAMIAIKPSKQLLDQTTWPQDILFENGDFVGYVMKRISDSTTINAIYSVNSKTTLPERIIIAKNICSSIQAVHDAGQSCGDLNPKNICVNTHNGRITLIDTESYHIFDPNIGKVYRCEVGIPEYLAPELQISISRNGQNLRTAPLPTFSFQTDLFALAVHIFALLMNGCHPFACTKNPNDSRTTIASQKTLNENIISGLFPFEDLMQGCCVPIYAPNYNYLPVYIRNLFHRAFKTKVRPTAVEWFNALSELQSSLISCKADNSHYFPDTIDFCPWCKLNK